MNTNKLRNKVRPALFIGVLSFASFSCTNLEDVALDKLDKSGASASAQLTSAFNQLGAFTDQANIYALQEHSTDEMQGPTRGTDWDDAGRWRNIHTHTWNGQSSDVVGAWDGLNRGHALANEVVFASGVDKASLAQALFIRSFMFSISWIYLDKYHLRIILVELLKTKCYLAKKLQQKLLLI